MGENAQANQVGYVDEISPLKLRFSQKLYCGVKSVLDFIIAIVALAILSPLFLIVAVAIKIDSKGPIFFIQKRIGKNGKEFNCVKFRSMSIKAKHDCPTYEYDGVESYITRVGKVIRLLSIDELPQLFNVITFKMYLISYRPVVPFETELNDTRAAFNLYQIKPGLTGWAQVNGRDVLAAHPTLKAKYDAYYLENLSPWLDVKVFFLTILKILKKADISEGVASTHDKDDVAAEIAATDACQSTATSVDEQTHYGEASSTLADEFLPQPENTEVV